MPVSPIPAGYTRVTAYLVAEDAKRALAWYVDVFGAEETMRLPAPDGSIMHAEFRIGDAMVMLAEQNAEYGAFGPKHFGGSPVSLVLYVEDVDAVFARAVAAGATEDRPVGDKPYGDRMGSLTDPFGHCWHLATHIEDVSTEEILRRMSGG
jgi:PhnB protein